MSDPVRVCVIGAGVSGLCILGMLKKYKDQGRAVTVTCYEKQDVILGLWNFTWRTGMDKTGEPVHASQYRDLFSNGPKEAIEFPDYTYEQHFGKAIPSFPPRSVLRDYLIGYFNHLGVGEEDVLLNHSVQSVTYCEKTKKFTVTALNLSKGNDKATSLSDVFDYCVVSIGHFSIPNVPEFPGLDSFPGRVMHSHDFRNAREFTGQRVLTVGNSYSGEDMMLQTKKFGAKGGTISYRSQPTGFKWPEGIDERPLVSRFDGNTAHFSDGSSGEYDAVILATGYLVHIPFMEWEYRLQCPTILNVPDLYRGVLWTPMSEGKKSADNRLFYIGMQDQWYTFTLFQLQAVWIAQAIKGLKEIPPVEECHAEITLWTGTNTEVTSCPYKAIQSQTDYLLRMQADTGFEGEFDAHQQFFDWKKSKVDDAGIQEYRNRAYPSPTTGTMAPVHSTPWMDLMDDGIDAYINAA